MKISLMVSACFLGLLTGCSDGGSSKGAPTAVDGTYYMETEKQADGVDIPESLLILEKGSARTITVRYDATTEENSTYSVSGNRMTVSTKPGSTSYDCNGHSVYYEENGQNSVANVKKVGPDLEIEFGGIKKVLKQAKQEDIRRILALPKCTIEK